MNSRFTLERIPIFKPGADAVQPLCFGICRYPLEGRGIADIPDQTGYYLRSANGPSLSGLSGSSASADCRTLSYGKSPIRKVGTVSINGRMGSESYEKRLRKH